MSVRRVILATPFRLCFLLAGAMACVWVPLWLMALLRGTKVSSDLGPIGWHAHEMVFGYAAMVLAGFLMTAARNWTKRETMAGLPLAALAIVWCAGRGLALRSHGVHGAVMAGIDGAFFAALACAIARPIYGARSKRNYAFPVLIAVMGLCDVAAHMGAHGTGLGATFDGHLVVRGLRGGLDVVALVILIFAARIIPLFTGNAVDGPIRTKGTIDHIGVYGFVGLAGLHLSIPNGHATAYVAIAVGAVNGVRLWGWGGSRTLRDPLLLVLHVGWGLLCTGIALGGMAQLWSRIPAAPALHLLTVGGIGVITLGMMVRVSLGHTGRPRIAPLSMSIAFAALVAAAVIRVAPSVWWTEHYIDALWVSGLMWAGTFAVFTIRFLPTLLSPRPDGKPG